jgi:hypothetical protein
MKDAPRSQGEEQKAGDQDDNLLINAEFGNHR